MKEETGLDPEGLYPTQRGIGESWMVWRRGASLSASCAPCWRDKNRL